MRVQQNQNSQLNFGMKIKKTKEFEKLSAAHGWELPLEKMEAHLEKMFPKSKETFEISPNLILAHKENDFFGPTYHFTPKGTKFESPKDVEKAITTTIHAREEMKKLSGFVRELNEKLGLKIDFRPKNICNIAGTDVKRLQATLKGIATGLSAVRGKEKYSAQIGQGNSTQSLGLKVSRGKESISTNFLFGHAAPRTEDTIARDTLSTIDTLKSKSIEQIQIERKRKNAARTKA